jgi:hypothetical protein
MICFFAATGLTLFLYSFTTHSNNTTEQNQIDKLKLRITALNSLHQVDPLTKDYETFVAQLKQLKAERRDWVPFFDLVTGNLYKSSRLIKMAVDKDAVVSLKLEFTALKDVAEYTTLLQKSELIEQIEMDNIQETYKSNTPPNPVKMNGSIMDPVAAPTTTETHKTSAEQMLELFGTKEVDSTFEGDRLLNQLNSIINKQSVKQQFGIDLPNSNNSKDSNLEGTPFSEQEIKDAQSALDNFKQKQLTTDPGIVSPEAPNASPEAVIDLTQYYVYEVSLSIKLKALLQGK